LVTLPKNFWARELGSVVIQLYDGEFTLSVCRLGLNCRVYTCRLDSQVSNEKVV